MTARAILVGASLSLSGRFAAQGWQAHHGLTLWADDVNQAGGLLVRSGEPRRPVRLLLHDDASRRAVAADRTRTLIERERVDLLLGPYSSVLALAAAEVAAEHDRTLWNHGGSSDTMIERGWRHVVNLLSPASSYFAPLLELAAQAPGTRASGRPVRRVALLRGANGTFPAAVIGGAREHAQRLGLEIVCDGTYEATTAQQVLDAAPDLILGAGTTEADIAFARALREEQARGGQAFVGQAPLVGLVAAAVQPFQDALGADADGFCGPSQWEAVEAARQDASEIGPTSTEFASAFRARFRVAPDYPAAQAYAAGLIVARCIELAGALEDHAVRAAAAQLDTSTFYGRFRVDPSTGQQTGHQVVVVQWQGGRKQVIWPPASATTAALLTRTPET